MREVVVREVVCVKVVCDVKRTLHVILAVPQQHTLMSSRYILSELTHLKIHETVSTVPL